MTWLNWLAAALQDVSPKVKAGLNWGVLATLALTLATTITPDMLAALGPWAPVVAGVLPIVVGQVAAWFKVDPLRAAGEAARQAPSDPTQPGASA